MTGKWTAKAGKMIFNVLVNYPKGSLILESIDMSDSSNDSIKMFSLFQNTIEKVREKKVVQVVTNNTNENAKAGDMLNSMFLFIYQTPCAAHGIYLMFGNIFKKKTSTGYIFTLFKGLHY